ncbi:hypothetical protein AYL99_11703 [Fonsecaea erecta]|uniref:Uncharacterized protein n=1 Tax=Fonsecaea erecta TaxID=1367422 RepID=A0A178Z2Y4_9EURO|nr:hypothetical protein AYL99_11703 [Fonsecaea erecta]OAP54168.1 hypothetical protein AYL99_11703 [Fonsecaea erecta]
MRNMYLRPAVSADIRGVKAILNWHSTQGIRPSKLAEINDDDMHQREQRVCRKEPSAEIPLTHWYCSAVARGSGGGIYIDTLAVCLRADTIHLLNRVGNELEHSGHLRLVYDAGPVGCQAVRGEDEADPVVPAALRDDHLGGCAEALLDRVAFDGELGGGLVVAEGLQVAKDCAEQEITVSGEGIGPGPFAIPHNVYASVLDGSEGFGGAGRGG